MKKNLFRTLKRAACFAALALASLSPASAQLSSQYGILDLAANGGINPNTGVAWAAGDQYRLAFHTDGTIDGTTNDPAVYDNFATAEANLSALGDGSITTSSGWTAMVWVNTDIAQNQGLALSNPSVRAGITDTTGGEIIGGAGVPVYAMDGTTAIARNNAVIMSGAWKSPFANVDSGFGPNGQGADSAVRLPVGATTATNTQNVHYSPFLDQFGAGDTGSQHGSNVWTGGFPGSHVNALGDAADDTTASWGSSNANNTGRVWNRFTGNTTDSNNVYALSAPLTVVDASDTTPPTLASTDIVDDKLGGPVVQFETVTYTVTFSEAMDASTVEVGDFDNTAATAAVTIDSVSPTGDAAVFEVAVTPTGAGTLQLQLKAGAVLTDVAGNALVTTSAIADDTIITVSADSTAPTLASADIVDDQFGGPVLEDQPVTYTLFFSEAMDPATVDVGDFDNSSATAATIDSVSATGDPSIFEVVVTPTEAGTLQLRVKAGAVLTDLPGNPLDTTSAIADDTIITVDADLVPTVVSFEDDVSGGPIEVIDSVIFAVTFSEDMNPATVDIGDFDNSSVTGITIDSVIATGDPAVFDVTVSPTEAGTIQLQIAAGAVLEDLTGNAVDTTSPIPDDTIIIVNADTTAPTLSSIVDNVSGGPVFETQAVTYLVTFSEAMDDLTVGASDFENASATAASIGSVSATGDPAVFEVVATATETGTLQLQIAMGASLTDLLGNPLDTSSALPDDTIITVVAAPDLEGELGLLNFTANGGINPNTGVAWAAGDQYRLAFHTDGTIDGTSSDPAFYDAFATAQAAAAGLGGNWVAMVWVNTDESLPQGTSPVSSPVVRSGTDDQTGGAGIGGAGVPVYATDGATCIARNNADIYNSWSNPFDGDAVIRIPAGTGAATQNVHYSPFLDQFGSGDTGNVHGASVWTGGFGSAVNPLGNSVDPDAQVRGSWGSSNANNTGRVWNRFQSGVTSQLSVYAISNVLTVSSGVPEALILKIDESGGNLDFEWNSLSGMQYDLLSSTDPEAENDPSLWAPYNDGTMTYEDLPATGTSTTLTGVQQVGPVRFFTLTEEEIPPIFETDFEADNGGFTVATTAGTDWEHGDPDSVGFGTNAVSEGNGGSTNCWATDLGDFSTSTVDAGYYADSTITSLRSPVIDLTGITAAELCFAEALDLEAGDTAVVNIIDDTTDAVISAAIYTATDASAIDANWATANGGIPITIPPAALGQPVRIEWSFTGFGGDTDDYLGWYIDDVAVLKSTP